MLNQIVLVGRIANEIKTEEGSTTAIILAVPRSYKNEDGIYDTDYIECILWKGIAETTAKYCKKGDMVGIKGRIQTESEESEEGWIVKSTKLIAEKVAYLSSKKGNE